MLSTIIIFIIILGILVFVHELGHFVAAKKSGVRVYEFGFGIPPRIFGIQRIAEKKIDQVIIKKKWRIVGPKKDSVSDDNESGTEQGTVYSINWLPLGGFVKLKGESGESVQDQDSLVNKSGGRRALVLTAGVLMNAILCAVLISIGFMIGLPQAIENIPANAQVKDRQIQIMQVLDNTPAKEAGLKIGDTIKALNGETMADITEMQKFINEKVDQSVTVTLIREQQEVALEITPIKLSETGQGGMGVGLIATGIVSYPIHLAVWKGVETTGYLVKAIVLAFGGIIKDLIMVKKVTVDLAGPVGIAVMTGQVARMGFIYLLQFTALLSINLAIINILPIPALDGGHLLMLLIEKIRRRALNQKITAIINNVFFMLLILLVLLVTVRDVSRFSDKFVNLLTNIKNIF